MKYVMYYYDKNIEAWRVHRNFANKEELLGFLSYGTSTNNSESCTHWSNRYLDDQNITCKDTTVRYDWEYLRDKNGEASLGFCGVFVGTSKLRAWHLEDEDGRTVDMNMFKDEIYDIVRNMHPYVRSTLYLRTPNRKVRVRQSRSHHHSYNYRCGTKNHRFGRTIKTINEIADDAEDILTRHQLKCLNRKPKDSYAKFMWYDDFVRKGPTGWKEHKHSKQWEAKQKRIADAVWVGSMDKRHIEDDAFIDDLLEDVERETA